MYDEIGRWVEATAILTKWSVFFGGSFHPDTVAGDIPKLRTEALRDQFDQDMERVFALKGVDPYRIALGLGVVLEGMDS